MNVCLDRKRRDRSGRQVEWNEEVELQVAPDAEVLSADPAVAVEGSELRQIVAQAIEKLPDEARRTLQLREIDGLSYAEIAASLGIPKGTVMSRLHYARRSLRRVLIEAGVMALVAPSEEAR